jgi:hypothetical protein
MVNVGRPKDRFEGMQAEAPLHYFKVVLLLFNDDVSTEWAICKCRE